MTDRELLTLAAKAAGIDLELWSDVGQCFCIRNGGTWNPLTDDGDEARLEAALRLSVAWAKDGVEVYPPGEDGKIEFFDRTAPLNVRQTARRRAGVQAAAEIGKESSAFRPTGVPDGQA